MTTRLRLWAILLTVLGLLASLSSEAYGQKEESHPERRVSVEDEVQRGDVFSASGRGDHATSAWADKGHDRRNMSCE
jgi:hypothetical protein